jgi:hypothetical protein
LNGGDGHLYFTGRIIGNYTGFEPLDDFEPAQRWLHRHRIPPGRPMESL